jgi:ribosomal protein S18 acetylase RimI-like enzyme
MQIRRAEQRDIDRLAELWQERLVILAQADPRVKAAPDARQRWHSQAAIKVADGDHIILVGVEGVEITGYIAGHITLEGHGVIEEIALDAHRYHGGLGRELVNALRRVFEQRQARTTLIRVPRRMAVEQAFWRSMGGTERTDVSWKTSADMMWMQL